MPSLRTKNVPENLNLEKVKNMNRIPMIISSLENDAETVKYEFDSLVKTIAKDLLETREYEEVNIMNSSNSEPSV